MTTNAMPHMAAGLNQAVNENATTLIFRMGWKQKDLARVAQVSGTTIGRKLKGLNDWTLPEVERVASATHVTVGELLGELPPYDVWLPRLDSNQQPFGNLPDYCSDAPVIDLDAYRQAVAS